MAYEDIRLPDNVPTPGFYYHYKHDPDGSVTNYAYEFLGIGHHTEEDCRAEDALLAIYRPLYPALVYKMGKLFDARPLSMFMGTVSKERREMSRFSPITDTDTIKQLEAVRDEMYPG